MHGCKAIVPLLLALLLSFSLTASGSAPDLMDRPGTIVHALSLPIGSTVYLDAVDVDSLSAGQFRISEWWSDRTLPVSMVPPAALTVGQLVDVEGVTGRLADGSPAILNPTVYGYLDKDGNLLPDPWVIKMPDQPVVWQWGKVDMTTISVSRLQGGTQANESEELLIPIEGTIGWAKQQDDTVTIDLTGKEVVAGSDQFDGCIYIEEADRSSGIRVATTVSFAVGDIVDVTGGTMAGANGEQYIAGATVRKTGEAVDPLAPVFMIHRSLGGESFGFQQEVTGTHGLNNVGLLMRLVGKVTYSGGTFAYIDDGSSADDGSGHIGVRVETDQLAAGNNMTLPDAGEEIFTMDGINSCMIPNDTTVRIFRPRTQGDITRPMVIGELDYFSSLLHYCTGP